MNIDIEPIDINQQPEEIPSSNVGGYGLELI